MKKINKVGQSDFLLFFFGCNLGRHLTRFVRQSQNKIRPKDLGKTIAPILCERASDFARAKRGCKSLRFMQWQVQSVGLYNLPHQFRFHPSSTFFNLFLWHTKSNGFNRKHGLYSPYFWKTWTSYSIFGVKMELYT